MSLFGGNDEESEGKKGGLSGKGMDSGLILKLFLVLIALITGAAAQHYLIEPLLEKQAESGLTQCRASLQLLNQQLDHCYSELNPLPQQEEMDIPLVPDQNS